MALAKHAGPRRGRPLPVSPLPRGPRLLARIADWHDRWLARRSQARWARELDALDDRILRDVGLNRMLVEARQAAPSPTGKAETRKTTIPPHCDRALAAVPHNIET